MNVAYNNKTIILIAKQIIIRGYLLLQPEICFRINVLLNKYFFLQIAYELLSQSRKLNKVGSPNKRGTLVRDSRVLDTWEIKQFNCSGCLETLKFKHVTQQRKEIEEPPLSQNVYFLYH